MKKFTPEKYAKMARENNEVYQKIYDDVRQRACGGFNYLELDKQYQDNRELLNSAISLLRKDGFQFDKDCYGVYTLYFV